jgi:hypothetical protein
VLKSTEEVDSNRKVAGELGSGICDAVDGTMFRKMNVIAPLRRRDMR